MLEHELHEYQLECVFELLQGRQFLEFFLLVFDLQNNMGQNLKTCIISPSITNFTSQSAPQLQTSSYE